MGAIIINPNVIKAHRIPIANEAYNFGDATNQLNKLYNTKI